MYPSWPMVFGALAGGMILGTIVPAKQPAELNLPNRSFEVRQDAEASAERSAKEPDKTSASQGAAASESTTTTDVSAKPASAGNASDGATDSRACGQQTWPYIDTTCLDRDAPVRSSVRVVNTEPTDPATAMQPQAADEKTSDDKNVGNDNKNSATEKEKVANKRPAERKPAEQARAREEDTDESEREESASASSKQAKAGPEEEQVEEPRRPRRATRNQPRRRQAEIPDEWRGERPRIIIRRDGTRIYVPPRSYYIRPLNDGYGRRW